MQVREHPHYVYTYAYPESMGGRVFYVGKGKGYRVNNHEYMVRRGIDTNPHKTAIIKNIWAAGEHVQKKILTFFPTEQEAFLYEIALIFFLDGLTNLTPGGEGKRNNDQEGMSLSSDFLLPADACRFLSISRTTLDAYVRQGRIKRYQTGTPARTTYKRKVLEELKKIKRVKSKPQVKAKPVKKEP